MSNEFSRITYPAFFFFNALRESTTITTITPADPMLTTSNSGSGNHGSYGIVGPPVSVVVLVDGGGSWVTVTVGVGSSESPTMTSVV